MNAITVEATLGLALSCARSFGEAVTRAACDAIAEKAELEELARSPLTVPGLLSLHAAPAIAAADARGVARSPLHTLFGSVTDAAEPTGAGAQAFFTALAGVDPLVLSAFDRVRFLKAAVAHAAWAESRVNAAMLAIAGVTRRIHAVQVGINDTRAERIEIEDAARSEIALAARWSEAQAQSRLESVRLVHLLLPATQQALASGALSQAHATVIADGAARLAVGLGVDVTHPATARESQVWQQLVQVASQLDRRATAIASRSTRSHARAAVTRIVDGLDPEGMRLRREQAMKQRDVWVQSEGDGNALLIARMSAMHANACLNRIRERAQQLRDTASASGKPDARRIGEHRSQALTDLVLLAGRSTAVEHAACVMTASGDASSAPRTRAEVQVVITLDTLLGLQEIDGSEDTAILRGITGDDELVPAAEIRDLLADPSIDVGFRRLVTDPVTGHLLDLSPRGYEPSQRLREFVTTRDARCRWPGCNQRATSARTDIDHAIPFDADGPTTRANLGALCRRHHLLKTHEGYNITESDIDGSCAVITPSGETYRHEPTAVIPTDGALTAHADRRDLLYDDPAPV